MVRRLLHLLACGAALAAALAGGSAAAQEDPLDVLTAAIERGGMAPADMAALYNSRGDAFVGRATLDSAGAAFNHAHALRPKNADPDIGRAGAHFAQGRFDPALGDYSAALRIERTDVSAYLGRAQVYYYLKRYPASVADLKLAAQDSPASRHAALWLYLAEWRAGAKPSAALAANPVRWAPNEWPGPLMALYLGTGTPAEVLEAASSADPVIQRAQECEALFYGGQYLLTRGKSAEGRDLLRRSLGACPPSRALHSAARIELGEAGKGR